MDINNKIDIYNEFLKTWPRERVASMTLEDYTSAGSKDSFCYWIESRLQDWGSIWGGSAYKFGIYQCANKPEREVYVDNNGRMHDGEYAWYSMYGKTREEAFENVRKLILEIIDRVRANDIVAIDDLKMGTAYKWKLAFHYQNSLEDPKVLDIYKFEKKGLEKLGLTFPKKAKMSDIYKVLLSNKPNGMSVYNYGSQIWSAMYDDENVVEDVIDMEEPKLEPTIAYYITQHDGETLTDKELYEIVKEMCDRDDLENNQALHLFGMLYPEQIGEKADQIAKEALNSHSLNQEILKGIKIGRFLRSLIRKSEDSIASSEITETDMLPQFLRALRTKPFVLLAGISGTGKSRIVRKLAQSSITEELQKMYDAQSDGKEFDRWQVHKPANFELVQVKPNWHNSLEVVGYKSNIGGSHYEYTPFIEFVARAWQHQDVPFFLCLDEMNLAPVEQYFAEFLSAIESRSLEKGEYETDPIIKPFREFGEDVCSEMLSHLAKENKNLRQRFENKGLTLPKNLFVLGTVNMDETTFSFSRKVLDRAMSIVMNDVDYENFFKGVTENDVEEMSAAIKTALIDREIKGVKAVNNDVETVKSYLLDINEILNNTPFKLGYRAANEALLYVSAAHSLLPTVSTSQALDEFTMMKILSRIEGDKRSVGTKLIELKQVITELYPKSYLKLNEMINTLDSKQFVSYWG